MYGRAGTRALRIEARSGDPLPCLLMRVRGRMLKFVAGLLVIAGLLLVVGLMLPTNQHIERSIILRGEGGDVFPLLASLRRWPEWTAWTTNRFPDMTLRFEGPDSGVGAVMMAAGKSSGDGAVRISSADPGAGIAYTLDFNHGAQLFAGAIRYTNTPEGLRVNWTLAAELGRNPLKRWLGLGMESLMGGDMKKGLENLKKEVEARR